MSIIEKNSFKNKKKKSIINLNNIISKNLNLKKNTFNANYLLAKKTKKKLNIKSKNLITYEINKEDEKIVNDLEKAGFDKYFDKKFVFIPKNN